ncbi:MAG: flavin reductase family protein, partial [Planctomycetota bacterium]|nr:flavin reductase family protein [Planctomycetota bacterium]
MPEFREITPSEFNQSPFKVIGEDWMLVAAGRPGRVNAMTASWGGLGVMWGRQVAFVVIRPQRYTKEFVDANATLSLNFLDPGEYRPVQNYFGSVSGRKEDKIAKTGLTLAFEQDIPYFSQSRQVLVCRCLFAQPYRPENFLDPTLAGEFYPEKD